MLKSSPTSLELNYYHIVHEQLTLGLTVVWVNIYLVH